AVGDDFPRRHRRRRHQHAALEGRHMAEIEPYVERAPVAGEVGAELVDDVRGPLGRAYDGRSEPATQVRYERSLALAKGDAHEPALGRGHEDAADGGGDR